MDLKTLIPSRNNFSIYALKPSEVPEVRRELANARREAGRRDQVFSSAKSLTLVVWPQIGKRQKAYNLLRCASQIDPILKMTPCTIHADNVVRSYVEGGYIARFEQSHLCEHLCLPFLEYAQEKKLDIDAESALLDDMGYGKIVTIFTGRYNHAILKDILSFSWHWVGRAVTRGEFPQASEFEKMLRLRLLTIENKEVDLSEVRKILTAK